MSRAGSADGAPCSASAILQDQSLQELLGRVAVGDEKAFAAVYDAVAAPVLGVARAVLRDHAQAEEVTQEVLVEVWRTAPRYRPTAGPP